MKNEQELKNVVKERYTQLATQKPNTPTTCCNKTIPTNKIYNIMMDDYSQTEGYIKEADLGLGCGLPTQFAKIKKGDTVIDLGSGAGNDCFVARHETGSSGKVIGIDFTPLMIAKARSHAEKLHLNNVEFREGDIDNLPINAAIADVVISNCVLNLVPNKEKVINEIFRVLKPGGHFSISDIVLVGKLPDAFYKEATMYAGCISGAIQKEDYLQLIKNSGFKNIILQKEKTITIPDNVLNKYLSTQETTMFKKGNTGIFSITVYAEKPITPQTKCCKKNA